MPVLERQTRQVDAADTAHLEAAVHEFRKEREQGRLGSPVAGQVILADRWRCESRCQHCSRRLQLSEAARRDPISTAARSTRPDLTGDVRFGASGAAEDLHSDLGAPGLNTEASRTPRALGECGVTRTSLREQSAG